MKKYFGIFILLLLLTGCSNKYQVSNLKISNSSPYYIEGVFRNDSENNCKYVTVDVEITSGSLSLDYQLSLLNVKPGEVKDMRTYCDHCKNLKDANDVSIKVKNIKCSE